MTFKHSFVAATLILAACGGNQVPSSNALLDRTFSSEELGIAFDYPSSFYYYECDRTVPVTVQEFTGRVEFLQEYILNSDCTEKHVYPESRTIATMYAERVTDRNDVLQFIHTVFSEDCEIYEESEYEGVTRLFIRSIHPPTDAPDFACNGPVSWNKSANVALFSSLGIKKGGYLWSSKTPISMQDGSIEHGFGYLVMNSVRYLK